MALKASEKRILQAMFKLSRPSTTTEIAKKADMGWNTVKKYLPSLKRRGYLSTIPKEKPIKWYLKTYRF